MKIAIVDCRMPSECKRRLASDGFYIIETKPHKKLSEPLSSHPDMLIFSNGRTLISPAEYCEEAPYIFEDITRLIPSLTLKLTSDILEEKYPRDAIFNALVMGDKIFLRDESVSRTVLSYARDAGLEIISVKQGYPACTVLPLSSRKAITADPGMTRALSENGIEVTLIERGSVELPPYEYGFIGGAAGIYRDRLYFIGDYKTHPDSEKIEKACLSAGLLPVSLAPVPLLDLGRIIFIDDYIQNNG